MKLPRPALALLLVLAGCNPPPPSQAKVYLSEKCEIVAIDAKNSLCKRVSWKCPNGVTTETYEC
jgi:uncharacterized lipoprotein NlpE involved in copper resistance